MNCEFIQFRPINVGDTKTLFNWRSSERIAKQMLTRLDDFTEHEKWVTSISTAGPPYSNWIIVVASKPVGYASIESNGDSTEATWGFYIGEDEYIGIGGLLIIAFHRYLFDIRLPKLQILSGVAYHHNSLILKLHRKLGYEEGTVFEHQDKSRGQLIPVSLTRPAWEETEKSLPRYPIEFVDE